MIAYLEWVEETDRSGRVALDGVGNPADAESEVGQDKVGGPLPLGIGLPHGVVDLVLVDVTRVLVMMPAAKL